MSNDKTDIIEIKALEDIKAEAEALYTLLSKLDKMCEMGGDFDLNTACDIREKVISEYDEIEQKFKEGK